MNASTIRNNQNAETEEEPTGVASHALIFHGTEALKLLCDLERESWKMNLALYTALKEEEEKKRCSRGGRKRSLCQTKEWLLR